MVPNPVQHPAGDFLLESDGLLHDQVARDANAARHTFAGIGVYQPELFEHTPAHQPAKLAPLLRQAMKNNQVCGTLHQSEWIDVGTPERLAALEGKIASIHYEK
jgi:MurNAc alpha-1-phosphate uridylyltransferase